MSVAAPTYAVVTFGCRVNQADSRDLERGLRAHGARPAAADEADIIVVNTCTVTASADQGARQIIRRIGRQNPSAHIVATGCYATRAPDDLADLPRVTAVVPNTDKGALVEQLVARRDLGLTTAERFAGGDGACGAPDAGGMSARTTTTLRVQTGCDQVCAYCIIPSTRGRGRSMPLAEVLAEVDRLAAEGYREAALTGVHIGSYGRDLAPRSSLLELLRALDRHPSPIIYRVSSLEPMDCDEAVVDLVAGSARFAPHFHLPLQHASDRMLTAMRRPYTVDHYRRVVDHIRTVMPDAAIGSDFVVGFPGETDADAGATTDYLASSPLTYLHVFPYSDRPGTEATGLTDKVAGPEIRRRARAVREVGAALSARFREAQVGSVRPALTIDGGRVALTDNYLKVEVPPGRPENERVRVRITDAGEPTRGELIS